MISFFETDTNIQYSICKVSRRIWTYSDVFNRYIEYVVNTCPIRVQIQLNTHVNTISCKALVDTFKYMSNTYEYYPYPSVSGHHQVDTEYSVDTHLKYGQIH
jgi:hypothetical protein